jgi:DNA-binding LytR/AlgR family response regulator
MRVLIVDNEPQARSALIRLSEDRREVDVAAGAAEELGPDVMLIDVDLPDMPGFEVLRVSKAGRPIGIMVRARPLGDSAFAPKRPLLVGKRKHRLYPLSAESVEYIESDGNYVTIHAASATYRSRDSVKRLSAELTNSGFVRVQRSLLINIRAISFVEPVGRGRFKFTLSSGPDLYSSSSYRESILRVLPIRRSHRGPES